MTIKVLVFDDNAEVATFVNDALEEEFPDAHVIAAYTINDAIKFHMEVRNVENAVHHIEDVLYSELLTYYGSNTLSEIEKNHQNKTEDGIFLS